ncbi:MAG: hypothetical protein AAFS12_17945 [Cyanobacteria bacterium J06632_19]
MVIGNEVTRIITLGKWSIFQVVNQDETSEKSGNIRARLIPSAYPCYYNMAYADGITVKRKIKLLVVIQML